MTWQPLGRAGCPSSLIGPRPKGELVVSCPRWCQRKRFVKFFSCRSLRTARALARANCIKSATTCGTAKTMENINPRTRDSQNFGGVRGCPVCALMRERTCEDVLAAARCRFISLVLVSIGAFASQGGLKRFARVAIVTRTGIFAAATRPRARKSQ